MYSSSMLGKMPMQIPSYEVRDYKIFFGNQYVPDAKWSEFKDLGYGYGIDVNHVFYMGQIIENADPFSFQIIDDTHAKDYQHVFQFGRIIKGLQPPVPVAASSNNESMNSSYSMSMDTSICMPMVSVPTQMSSYEIHDFKVFYAGKYVPDARWIDFTNLSHGYGKDIHNVFFMGHIVEGAHAFSFEVLNKGYAKDKKHVFHNGQIVQDLKPCGFKSS